MPLQLQLEMEASYMVIGSVFTVMTLSAMFAFVAVPALCKGYTVRQILLMDFGKNLIGAEAHTRNRPGDGLQAWTSAFPTPSARDTVRPRAA